MIIEDEGRAICAFDEEETIPETQPIEIGGEEYINRRAEIRCTETFHNLRNDLVEHIYEGEGIKVKDNILLREFSLYGLTLGSNGYSQLEVCFSIDVNGILLVSAEETSTGQQKTITITKT
ncbi:unnamed protein product [Lactuca virosa]|uniref:Uncharacterized protein n=1 Tax=Lactuca virosa TaxID=75947 RepID=A0AAU9LDJ9_9ASTR|nr:unnamed protein product [Lactuca virosa]